jgi:hypothetical protein
VTFTKVFTVYLSQIHTLHHSPFDPVQSSSTQTVFIMFFINLPTSISSSTVDFILLATLSLCVQDGTFSCFSPTSLVNPSWCSFVGSFSSF